MSDMTPTAVVRTDGARYSGRGRALAEELLAKYPGRDVEAVAVSLGLRVTARPGGDCACRIICGSLVGKKHIEVYEDGLKRLERRIAGRLPVGLEMLRRLAVAHEIYHALAPETEERREAEEEAAAFATKFCGLPFDARRLDEIARDESPQGKEGWLA